MIHDALNTLTLPVDELRPHPENARQGDTDLIAESIRAHGQYRPIVAQKSTGYILAGNHTYAAALEEGFTELAVVVLDVDDATARRILLADNRTADLGVTDPEQLLALVTVAGGPEFTGYTQDDLDRLLDPGDPSDPPPAPAPAQPDDDEPPLAQSRRAVFKVGEWAIPVDEEVYLSWITDLENTTDDLAGEVRRRLGLA